MILLEPDKFVTRLNVVIVLYILFLCARLFIALIRVACKERKRVKKHKYGAGGRKVNQTFVLITGELTSTKLVNRTGLIV